MIRKILITLILLIQVSYLTSAAENQPLQDKFQKLIKKYGYVIYDLKHNSEYYEIYTTQNITFKLYNFPGNKNLDLNNKNTINLMKETVDSSKPLLIYYTKEIDSFNRVIYYIDYSIIDKNFTNLEDYYKNFSKFENSLNINLLKITDRCKLYNINCDILLNLYTYYFSFKLNSNSFEDDFSFYYEFISLLFVFYTYYLIKYKVFVYKRIKYSLNINLQFYFYFIILFSLFIVFRLIINKIDLNYAAFTISSILILIFSLGNNSSKLTRYQTSALAITLVSIIGLVIFTWSKENCTNFDVKSEFVNNMLRYTYKKSNICGKSLFEYPVNFNDQVPIVFNNYLIYHPKYKNISNLNINSFNLISIQEDSYIYSSNEDLIISFLIGKYKELQLKVEDTKYNYSNTVITIKNDLSFSVYCNKDVLNQKLVINEFYKLNDSNNYKRVTTDNLLNCTKNQKLNFNIKLLLDSVKLINIQDSKDFVIIIESNQADLPLNMYLYSNSVFFPSKTKTDKVQFYNLHDIKNLNFNWEEETYNNPSKRKAYIESLSNSIVKNELIYNVEISTLQPNSIFYRNDLGY